MITNKLILIPSKDCSNKNITSMRVKTYNRAKQITGNHNNWVRIQDAFKYNSLKRSVWYDSQGLKHKMK